MFSGGKTAVDAGAGITPIVLSIASWAGIIAPILTCLSAGMAMGWFVLRYVHYARHGRDIPS